jgi:hypothetical protein
MSLVATTLSTAVAVGDDKIKVASATTVAVDRYILIDQELMQVTKAYDGSSTIVPVTRGLNGTVSAAHAASAYVRHGVASDFASAGPGGPMSTYPSQRARDFASYSASGAIALPSSGRDLLVLLNGTSTLSMTILSPTKDLDGSIVTVVAGGNAASTIVIGAAAGGTTGDGFGGAGTSYDIVTLNASGQAGFQMAAANGYWVLLGSMAGTLTNIVPTTA